MAYDLGVFQKLLSFCVEKSVSDVHLREGEAPYLRIRGDLRKINGEIVTAADMKILCQIMFGNEQVMKGFDTLKEYDCSYQFGTVCRVRVSFLKFQKKSKVKTD